MEKICQRIAHENRFADEQKRKRPRRLVAFGVEGVAGMTIVLGGRIQASDAAVDVVDEVLCDTSRREANQGQDGADTYSLHHLLSPCAILPRVGSRRRHGCTGIDGRSVVSVRAWSPPQDFLVATVTGSGT